MAPSPGSITRLLVDWRDGDKAALDWLIPLVYKELAGWLAITCAVSAPTILYKRRR